MEENWNDVKLYNQTTASESIEILAICEELDLEDILEIINADADKIKIDGTIYRFDTIQIGTTLYVIYIDVEYIDGHRELIEEMLQLFFEREFKNYFQKKFSVWSEFTDHCIAYRGGRGQSYTIWEYIF